MAYMNKEVDDMAKDFLALNSQFARLEKLVAHISDKQATLVNKMAAKPEICDENHEDLKVLGVTPIESLFYSVKPNHDGAGYESTLVEKRPNDSESIYLDAKNTISGVEDIKTLSSDEITT